MAAEMSAGTFAVAVVLYGSRGDIQPGVCLALELQSRGCKVSVVVPPNLVAFARGAGVESVYAAGLDSHAAWSSSEAKAVQRSHNPFIRIRFAVTTVRAGFKAFDEALVALFIDPDGPLNDVHSVIVAPLCQDRGLAIAQRLQLSMTVLRYGPMSENGVMGAIPGLTDRWSARWKRRSWRAADQLTWLATGWNENSFRRRIGLPKAHGPLPRRLSQLGVPQIQAYDPAVIPGLADEWGATRPIVGYFDLAAQHRKGLDAVAPAGNANRSIGSQHTGTVEPVNRQSLSDWLAAGDSPIFITFGSMPLSDPAAVIGVLCKAARQRGRRCIVVGSRSPHGDYGVVPATDDVLYLAAVDHSWLLPQCVAAIHHGGAGTTAAVLRAGLPMFICAVTADQPFWGQRITELGVGSSTRIKALTNDVAAKGVAEILAPQTRAAARELGAFLVSPEKAVAAAADIVESRERTLAGPGCGTPN